MAMEGKGFERGESVVGVGKVGMGSMDDGSLVGSGPVVLSEKPATEVSGAEQKDGAQDLPEGRVALVGTAPEGMSVDEKTLESSEPAVSQSTSMEGKAFESSEPALPRRTSVDEKVFEGSEPALSQSTSMEGKAFESGEPALPQSTSMDEKAFESGHPIARVEEAASELSSPPQGNGPQYPPTRTVALIVTALYLAVFLIALVSCTETPTMQND